MAAMEPSPTRDLAHDQNSPKHIPFDLTIEIFSRLPAKSIIRFQTLSKLWFSIIRSKYFSDSFLIHSKTRPRLLFTFEHFDSQKRIIFSAPEHDIQENSSTARHDMTISDLVYNIEYSRPVNGLICCTRGSSIAVCNPTTRQILKLPDVTLNGRVIYARLGYDPVEDKYKVLCVMMHDHYDGIRNTLEQESFVFTLGSQQQEWKKIEVIEEDPYTSFDGGICINGAIYFVTKRKIARFDVRSEKMEFINAPLEDMLSEEDIKKVPVYHGLDEITTINAFAWTLVNHQGKLGGIDYTAFRLMRLWIQEEEDESWNMMKCDVPTEWGDLFRAKTLSSPGEIHTGEFMLVSYWVDPSKPFSVFYYDIIRESFRSDQVEGIAYKEFRRGIRNRNHNRRILCFPGHIENIVVN